MKSELRTLIVDDEESGRKAIEQLISLTGVELEIIGKASSIETAYQCIVDHSPDLVFLDIQLQNQTSFDLFQMDFKHSFETIFITAYDEYALKAFKANAISYLLKPVEPAEFERAVRRAIDLIISRKGDNNVPDQPDQLSRLFKGIIPVSTGSEIEYLRIDQILYAKAFKSYAQIFLSDGSSRVISRNLSYLERKISNPTFIRLHRSYLVNANTIKKWNKADGGSLVLSDNTRIPISREGRKILDSLL